MNPYLPAIATVLPDFDTKPAIFAYAMLKTIQEYIQQYPEEHRPREYLYFVTKFSRALDELDLSDYSKDFLEDKKLYVPSFAPPGVQSTSIQAEYFGDIIEYSGSEHARKRRRIIFEDDTLSTRPVQSTSRSMSQSTSGSLFQFVYERNDTRQMVAQSRSELIIAPRSMDAETGAQTSTIHEPEQATIHRTILDEIIFEDEL